MVLGILGIIGERKREREKGSDREEEKVSLAAPGYVARRRLTCGATEFIA